MVTRWYWAEAYESIARCLTDKKRMTNIKTYTGATLVKDYRLTYCNAGAYHVNTSNVADGSLLTKIQECDGAAIAICLNPTTFTWVAGTVNAATFGAVQPLSGISGLKVHVLAMGDFNGDGKSDILYDVLPGYKAGGSTGNLYVAFTNGSGGFTGVFNTGIPGGQYYCTDNSVSLSVYHLQCADGTMGYSYTRPYVGVGDVNADGLAGIIVPSGVYFSSGSMFRTIQNSPTGGVLAVAYVNGDGKADVLYDVE
jgi:hypothetical protein